MQVFEITIALLFAGALLTALSRRIGAPYPALVALAGAALALVPGTPTLALDPELALALFVAPVLLDAAFDTSLRDLRANWRSVVSLAIGAVLMTIAVVACVARWLVPNMSWAAAVALGAIVAPPDAAAATAVLRQLRPPHQVLVILEGESLFNDASALLIYRLAVGVAMAGAPLTAAKAVPALFAVTLGSVLLGFALSKVMQHITPRVHDAAISVVVQFGGTFGVWLLAERLHLSGVLTMVVFAMATARRSADVMPASIRIPSYAVWEVAVFVLNVLAFILIGFQLKDVIERLDSSTLRNYTVIGAAVCAATVISRLGWLSFAPGVGRWLFRLQAGDRARAADDDVSLSPRAAAVVGWCGMRGIVTLAAALALPTGPRDGATFPYRDLILVAAFCVVLGTLVVQGLTLRPLMSWLRLEDDGKVEREVRLGRVEMLRAALTATAALPQEEVAGLLRRRYQVMLSRAEVEHRDAQAPERAPDPHQQHTAEADTTAVLAALSAERQRLVGLRADGTIGDNAFQQLEQALDLEELHLQQLLPSNRGD